jgi:hypothetical protein
VIVKITMWRAITWLILLAIAAFMGARYRADQIQTSCEALDRLTVINGTPYICGPLRWLEQTQTGEVHHGNPT